MRYIPPGKAKMSPRSKGIRQGAMLMLSTILLVPLVAIFTVNFSINPELFVPFTAVFCFVGGLLRILYAAIMEDANPPIDTDQIAGYATGVPQLDPHARSTALPPAANNVPSWRSRPITAEIYQPPSVTENTTRLLDKDEPKNR
jgi:hypothetical protein